MISKFRFFSTTLLVSFVFFLAAGCGDSNDDFVLTGNSNTGSNQGSQLVFRFQRPTAQTVVPANTTTVRIDLYSTETPAGSSLLLSDTRLYADLIVLENVPATTRSVNVVLFGEDGVPFGTYTKPVNVPSGSRVEVLLSDTALTPVILESIAVTPNPVNFFISAGNSQSHTTQLTATATINGTQYAVPFGKITVTPEHENVVDVLANGTAIAKFSPVLMESSGGPFSARLNTTLTASYTLNGVTKTGQAPVRIHSFFSLLGYLTQIYGNIELPVLAGDSVDLDDEEFTSLFYIGPDGVALPIASDDVTTALSQSSAGISLDPVTKILTIEGSVQLGTKFKIQNTWLDNRPNGTGHTFTETLSFVVSDESIIDDEDPE